MEIYYVNHKNKKIDFMGGNYAVEESSFFSHSWDYETQELQDYGEKITRMKKKLQNHTMILHIESHGSVSCEQAYDVLFDIIETDIYAESPGRLYVEGAYVSCYLIVNKPKYFVPEIGVISCELGFIMPYPFWITEQNISIEPITNTAGVSDATGLKTYPYTYSYTYPFLQTETSVYIDHYKDSYFRMIVYGPTTSVLININGHPYQVEYPLEAGEYMVIDSRPFADKEKRLYVARTNGETENIFHYRSTEYSVFKKIPAGLVKINYARTYGVDLTIFKERSEPPWKSLL